MKGYYISFKNDHELGFHCDDLKIEDGNLSVSNIVLIDETIEETTFYMKDIIEYISEEDAVKVWQEAQDRKALLEEVKNHPDNFRVKWGDSLREQYDNLNKLIPYSYDITKIKECLEEAKQFLNKAHKDDNDTLRLLDIMYAEDFIECALTELEED